MEGKFFKSALILAILLFLYMSFSAYASSIICYQETANVSESCGGVDSGVYSESGDCVNFEYFYDGDWGTDAGYITNNCTYYVNYTRPTDSVSTSLWRVSDGNGEENLSIPASCWSLNSTNLSFEVTIDSSDGSVYWSCRNSTGLVEMRYAGSGMYVLEEGMRWNISDETAPTVYITSPSNTSYTTLPVNVNFTTNENAGWCGYNLDGGTNTSLSNSSKTNWYTQTNTSLSTPHTHQLTAYCNDTYGNMRLNSTIWFTYDATAPTITITSPGNSSYPNLPVNINATTGEDAATCLYNLDGGDNTSLSNSSKTNWYVQTNTSLEYGHTYQLSVYCNDTAGNMASNSTIWFTYQDIIAPTITITSPGNISYPTLPVNINVTTGENASACLYNLDDGDNSTLSNSSKTNWYVQTNMSLEYGHTYQLSVYCNDTVGNMAMNSTTWFTHGHDTFYCDSCQSCSNYLQNGSMTYDDTLRLIADLYNASSYCITFNGADDKVFDCDGHTIWSDNSGISYGIHLSAGSNNNTIMGCTNISYFQNGIYVYASSNNTLTNITAIRNTQYGIILKDNPGIAYSNNNTLTNIIASNNSLHGIWLYASSNNILTNITANYNTQYGIYLYHDNYGDNNTLTNITANYNSQYGIYIDSSIKNNLTDIHLESNGFHDIFFDNPTTNDCNNNMTNITGSGGYPIRFFNYSVTLSDETLSELILCNADNSVIDNITIIGSTQTTSGKNNGIIAARTDGSTFVNLNLPSNFYGIYLYYSNNNTLTNITSITNNRGVRIDYSSNNTLTNINTSDGQDGIYLLSSSNNNLTNITSYENTEYGIYLQLNSNNNTITGMVTHGNTQQGVYLLSSSNNTLADITTFDNYYDGVYISSNNNTFTNITSRNNTRDGIRIYSTSQFNTFNDSNVSGNSNYGIYLEHTGTSYPTYNTLYNNIINNRNNLYSTNSNNMNYWNTTLSCSSGSNIIGGSCIGGNYWGNYSGPGTGYSDTCIDNDRNGICDSSYTNRTNNTDYLPLSNDVTWPTITISSPLNQSYSGLPDMNVTTNEYAAACLYNIDSGTNTTFSNSSMTNWFAQITPSQGTHHLFVYCNDTNGNMGSNSTVWFTYSPDSTPPTIYISIPVNTTYTSSQISLNVSSSESISTWKYQLNSNGSNHTFTPNTTITLSLGGLNNLTVWATDSAGNINSSTTYFTYEQPAVGMTITSPGNQSYNSTISLNVTTGDNASACLYNIDAGGNSTLSNTSMTNWYSAINSTEGTHNLFVWCNNSIGNFSMNSSIWFTVDTAPPIIYVSSPANTTYNTTTINLQASTSETVLTRIYQLNSNGTNNSFPINTTINTSLEGLNNITIWATDAAGNTNSTTVWFTRDTTPPTITIQSPLNQSVHNTMVNLNITTSEDASYCIHGGVGYDEMDNDSMTNWFKQVTPNSDGEYQLAFWCRDVVGNEGTNFSIWFTYDTTPPIILTSSPGNTTYTTTTIQLNLTASDESISTLWYQLNSNGTNITFTPNTTVTGTEGQNHLTIWANDTMGYLNFTTIWFTIDQTQPIIGFAYPTPDNESYTQGDNSVYFNVSSNEQLAQCFLDNGTANTSMTVNSNYCYYNLASQANQTVVYRWVWARDDAGNWNRTGDLNVTINLTNCTVRLIPIINYPNGEGFIWGQPIPFNGTVLDACGNLVAGASVYYNIYKSPNQFNRTNWQSQYNTSEQWSEAGGWYNYTWIDTTRTAGYWGLGMSVSKAGYPTNFTFYTNKFWLGYTPTLSEASVAEVGNCTGRFTFSIKATDSDGNYNNVTLYVRRWNETGWDNWTLINQTYQNNLVGTYIYFYQTFGASDWVPGTYSYTFNTTDIFNYSDSEDGGNFTINECFFVAPVSPTLSNGSYTNYTTIGINMTFYNIPPTFNVTNCTLRFNNGTATNYTDNGTKGWCNFSFAGQPDGSWNYSIWVNNTLGSETWNGTWYVVVDTAPPLIYINSPANQSYDPTSGTIPLQVSESETFLTRIYQLDGNGTNSSFPINTTFNMTAEGLHNLTVWETDLAGNTNSTTTWFTVNTSDPYITIHSPANQSYTTATVTLSVSSNYSMTSWKYQLNSNGTNNTFTPNTTTLSPPNGFYNITIWGTSIFGKENLSVQYFTIAVPDEETPPSGGGGSSGGGNYNQTNQTHFVTKVWNIIYPGEEATINVTDTGMGVSNITLRVSDEVRSVSIKIEIVSVIPADVNTSGIIDSSGPNGTGTPGGTDSQNGTGSQTPTDKEVKRYLHKYFQIETKNINDSDIRQARIDFRVDKKWVLDNKINLSTIKIERWNNGTWHTLKTVVLNDTDYLYYNLQADTPGFSIFRVVGEKLLAMVSPQQACNSNGLCETGESPLNCPSDCKAVSAESCVNFSLRCRGNVIELCLSNQWREEYICQYGCNNTTCNEPVAQLDFGYLVENRNMIFIASLGIAVIILIIVIIRKPVKPQPEKLKSEIAMEIAIAEEKGNKPKLPEAPRPASNERVLDKLTRYLLKRRPLVETIPDLPVGIAEVDITSRGKKIKRKKGSQHR